MSDEEQDRNPGGIWQRYEVTETKKAYGNSSRALVSAETDGNNYGGTREAIFVTDNPENYWVGRKMILVPLASWLFLLDIAGRDPNNVDLRAEHDPEVRDGTGIPDASPEQISRLHEDRFSRPDPLGRTFPDG